MPKTYGLFQPIRQRWLQSTRIKNFSYPKIGCLLENFLKQPAILPKTQIFFDLIPYLQNKLVSVKKGEKLCWLLRHNCLHVFVIYSTAVSRQNSKPQVKICGIYTYLCVNATDNVFFALIDITQGWLNLQHVQFLKAFFICCSKLIPPTSPFIWKVNLMCRKQFVLKFSPI